MSIARPSHQCPEPQQQRAAHVRFFAVLVTIVVISVGVALLVATRNTSHKVPAKGSSVPAGQR